MRKCVMLQPHSNAERALNQIPTTCIGFIFKKGNCHSRFSSGWHGISCANHFKLMDNSREEVRDPSATTLLKGKKKRWSHGWWMGNVPLRLVRIRLANGRRGCAYGVAVKRTWERQIPAPRPLLIARTSWFARTSWGQRKISKWWKSRHFFQIRRENSDWWYYTQLQHLSCHDDDTCHILVYKHGLAERKVPLRQSSVLAFIGTNVPLASARTASSEHPQWKTTCFINAGQATQS